MPPAVGPADLDWWLELAPTLEWTWAKTYARLRAAPLRRAGPHARAQPGGLRAGRRGHPHVRPARQVLPEHQHLPQRRRVEVLDDGRAGRGHRPDQPGHDGPVLRPAGRPEHLHRGVHRVRRHRRRLRPATRPLQTSAVRAQIAEHFRGHSPRTLDVGCGAGALLDLGVVSPADYTGVDSSQGMLNELVLKHPAVRRLIPARFEDVSDDDLGGPLRAGGGDGRARGGHRPVACAVLWHRRADGRTTVMGDLAAHRPTPRPSTRSGGWPRSPDHRCARVPAPLPMGHRPVPPAARRPPGVR